MSENKLKMSPHAAKDLLKSPRFCFTYFSEEGKFPPPHTHTPFGGPDPVYLT